MVTSVSGNIYDWLFIHYFSSVGRHPTHSRIKSKITHFDFNFNFNFNFADSTKIANTHSAAIGNTRPTSTVCALIAVTVSATRLDSYK
jgi:hypothetical protein